MEEKGIKYNPKKGQVFRALRLTPKASTQIVLIGQDPYPDSRHADGLAFSSNHAYRDLPASLVNILKEYSDDLGYLPPSCGDLSEWARRGCLLINAYPTCEAGKPGSHRWGEWEYLTNEIIEEVDNGHTIFILLGSFARSFNSVIRNSPVLETSHPSPLGAHRGFLGSRIFSRANDELVNLGKEPFNWRLDDGPVSSNLHLSGRSRQYRIHDCQVST